MNNNIETATTTVWLRLSSASQVHREDQTPSIYQPACLDMLIQSPALSHQSEVISEGELWNLIVFSVKIGLFMRLV